jgi:hypothetical protein
MDKTHTRKLEGFLNLLEEEAEGDQIVCIPDTRCFKAAFILQDRVIISVLLGNL